MGGLNTVNTGPVVLIVFSYFFYFPLEKEDRVRGQLDC